jgi:hypothetical protein
MSRVMSSQRLLPNTSYPGDTSGAAFHVRPLTARLTEKNRDRMWVNPSPGSPPDASILAEALCSRPPIAGAWGNTTVSFVLRAEGGQLRECHVTFDAGRPTIVRCNGGHIEIDLRAKTVTDRRVPVSKHFAVLGEENYETVVALLSDLNRRLAP